MTEQWLNAFTSSTKVFLEPQSYKLGTMQFPRPGLSVNAVCPNTPKYLSHFCTQIAKYALNSIENTLQHLNLAHIY